MGVATLTGICEADGLDIEEIIATRKYEIDLMEKAGILQYTNTGTNSIELEKIDINKEEIDANDTEEE